MQLLGGDPQLCSQAQLAPVSKASGGVDHDDGAVHAGGKAAHHRQVLGENSLGVSGGVAADVLGGRIDVVNHPHSQVQAAVLGLPVLLARRHEQLARTGRHGLLLKDLARGVVGVQDHATLPQRTGRLRQVGRRHLAVDEERLSGVTHAHALCLGVDDDRHRVL